MTETKKKRTTVDELAIMVAKGFEEVHDQFVEVHTHFAQIDQRFDEVNKRIDLCATKEDLDSLELRIFPKRPWQK